MAVMQKMNEEREEKRGLLRLTTSASRHGSHIRVS